MVTDANVNEKAEVESQYTLKFQHNNNTVHLTFYFTKCSIWIQGSPTKINNVTIAQFFAIHYLEKVANMVVKAIPMEDIKNELRKKIESYLEVNERSGDVTRELEKDKCVSCPKNCSNNGKSQLCVQCSRSQHFNCAGIKSDEERTLFITGGEEFVCTRCFSTPGLSLAGTRPVRALTNGVEVSAPATVTTIANVDGRDDSTEEVQPDPGLARVNNQLTVETEETGNIVATLPPSYQ